MRFNAKAICLFLVTLTGLGAKLDAGDHNTVRFVYSSGYPQELLALAFSPDSSELAVSTSDGQVSFIRAADGETKGRFRMSPFSMAYSRDGARVLMISRYQSHLLDVAMGRPVPFDDRGQAGFLGIRFEKRNGKLVVSEILSGGPAERQGNIHVGDELVGVGQSKGGNWYDLIGESVEKTTKLLRGPAGTHVRIEIVARGEIAPTVHTLTRQTARIHNGTLSFVESPRSSVRENVVWCLRDGRHSFAEASSGRTVASIETETIENIGQYAISPDSSKFAVLSTLRQGKGLAIEVFDLPTQRRERLIEFPKESCQAMAFSADASKLLIGTHYTTEVLDWKENEFLKPITLGLPPAPAVEKVNLGYGGSAVKETISASRGYWAYPNAYHTPKFVECLDVSSRDHLAVGCRGGVRLFRISDGTQLATFGALSDKEIERVKFSPDGRMLAYYCNGALHIVDVGHVGDSIEIAAN